MSENKSCIKKKKNSDKIQRREQHNELLVSNIQEDLKKTSLVFTQAILLQWFALKLCKTNT